MHGTVIAVLPMRKFVEIRSYNIESGTRAEFHRLMTQQARPLLKKWAVDVIACGPSPHDECSYYLIRGYDSLDERIRSQDAFYAGTEWREGPREAILALIENSASIVIAMDQPMIAALRDGG